MQNAADSSLPQKPHLHRNLTLIPTTALVIGSVIGSGIFVSSAKMARDLGSGSWLLAVWLVGGVMTLFGALTLCELAAQRPVTGGLYEYFREIYGEGVGFLYGWANFIIAGSGGIAGLAFIFAHHLEEFVSLPRLGSEWEELGVSLPLLGTIFPFDDVGAKAIGALLIAFLTWINIRGVELGAKIQTVSTFSKIVAILGIIGVAFIGGQHVGSWTNFNSVSSNAPMGWAAFGSIFMALSAAFWAYGGWANVASIAGEVHEPARTIPRAIVLGTFCFIALYILINLAYLFILPVDQMGSVPNDRLASRLISTVFGGGGGAMIAALIMLSTFDTTNSTVLTNGRIYYAMAKENMFWKPAGLVHRRFGTPHVSLICQGLWSMLLLFSGSFELVATMFVFVNWVLFLLMALGVFILRSRHPHANRPFKVPGYPWVPAIFVLFSFSYVVGTLVQDVVAFQEGRQHIVNSAVGLLLVFSGLPIYFVLRNRQRSVSTSVDIP